MSKGLGRLERAIVEASNADPDNAFSVGDLCDLIYSVEPEKKHRVAVLRAMKNVVARNSDYAIEIQQGVGAAIYRPCSPHSVRMALGKLAGQTLLRRDWCRPGWRFRLGNENVESILRSVLSEHEGIPAVSDLKMHVDAALDEYVASLKRR